MVKTHENKPKNPENTGDTPNWTNQDNDAFYQEVKAEGLQELADRIGLTDGCDVQAIKPYWENAKNLLDVGTGYGRVIDALRANGYKGSITAIERNNAMHDYTKKRFGDSINLLHMDIYDCEEITERFDVILFLWSGLADFPFEEQAKVIGKLAKLLNKDGVLIVDSMPTDITPIGSEVVGEQAVCLKKTYSTIYGHMPSSYDIKDYAISSNLKHTSTSSITTDTNRIRNIYTLKNVSAC